MTSVGPVPGKMSVMVHGGAGRFYEHRARMKLPVMQKSLESAWSALVSGKGGAAAVAAALREMEASEYFNAGYGGYPNANGIVLLDAAIMDGARNFVSLMNVRRVKYPGMVALDMLGEGNSLTTIWTHELMQALDEGSDELKQRYGWVKDHQDLLPQFVIDTLKKGEGEFSEDGTTHGTVGCVVSDENGKLFAGISTGGVNHKVNGRIGDAPMVGLGLYADDELCSMTTTGNGEALLKCFPTGFIIGRLRSDLSRDSSLYEKDLSKAQKLIDEEFQEFSRKSPNKGGGIIIIPKGGEPIYAFSTAAIPIGVRVGTKDEVFREEVYIDRRNEERYTLADI